MVLQNRLAMVLRHLLIIAPIGAKRQRLLTERLPYGRGRHHRGFAGDFPRNPQARTQLRCRWVDVEG